MFGNILGAMNLGQQGTSGAALPSRTAPGTTGAGIGNIFSAMQMPGSTMLGLPPRAGMSGPTPTAIGLGGMMPGQTNPMAQQAPNMGFGGMFGGAMPMQPHPMAPQPNMGGGIHPAIIQALIGHFQRNPHLLAGLLQGNR